MNSFYSIVAQLDLPKSDVGPPVWDGGGSYGLVMAGLIMLFALLVGVFLYVRRYGFTRLKKAGELEILETRPLGGRQFLVVGRYGQEKFLLGVCPGRIDYLCALDSGMIEEKVPDAKFSEIYDQAEKHEQ